MSLDAVSKLGTTLNTIKRDQDDLKDAINPNEEVSQRQYSMSDDIIVEQLPIVAKRRDIQTSSLWDVATWDVDNWNETYGAGFILGHASQARLGGSELGDSGTDQVVVLVYNDDNRYLEYFKSNLFEDTTITTATWGSDGLVFSTSLQLAQSLAIAYSADDPQTYVSATLQVEGTDTGDGLYYLSPDGGTNWETITPGTSHTFTNVGTELRFKISNDSNAITIDKITVQYITS